MHTNGLFSTRSMYSHYIIIFQKFCSYVSKHVIGDFSAQKINERAFDGALWD